MGKEREWRRGREREDVYSIKDIFKKSRESSHFTITQELYLTHTSGLNEVMLMHLQ